MVHPDLVPWVIHMWKVCTSLHRHVPLAGKIPHTTKNRTQFAAGYTTDFVDAILDTCEEAYEGTPPSPPKPTLLGGEESATEHRKEEASTAPREIGRASCRERV